MTANKSRSIGSTLYLCLCLMLTAYFGFTAVRGDYGIGRRIEADAEARSLRIELAALQTEVTRLENLTLRLSDDYLDLDLLDEQARSVLGMMRSDEIVIR